MSGDERRVVFYGIELAVICLLSVFVLAGLVLAGDAERVHGMACVAGLVLAMLHVMYRAYRESIVRGDLWRARL